MLVGPQEWRLTGSHWSSWVLCGFPDICGTMGLTGTCESYVAIVSPMEASGSHEGLVVTFSVSWFHELY